MLFKELLKQIAVVLEAKSILSRLLEAQQRCLEEDKRLFNDCKF